MCDVVFVFERAGLLLAGEPCPMPKRHVNRGPVRPPSFDNNNPRLVVVVLVVVVHLPQGQGPKEHYGGV